MKRAIFESPIAIRVNYTEELKISEANDYSNMGRSIWPLKTKL